MWCCEWGCEWLWQGAAEVFGASRMDDEEDVDWDSDEEEQAGLAAAAEAAKGKVRGV